MIEVKYIVVPNDPYDNFQADKVADLMRVGGVILESWVTPNGVHHLISLEEPQEIELPHD